VKYDAVSGPGEGGAHVRQRKAAHAKKRRRQKILPDTDTQVFGPADT
jgi:hypothetical protein